MFLFNIDLNSLFNEWGVINKINYCLTFLTSSLSFRGCCYLFGMFGGFQVFGGVPGEGLEVGNVMLRSEMQKAGSGGESISKNKP